jgi:hypothetical protein
LSNNSYITKITEYNIENRDYIINFYPSFPTIISPLHPYSPPLSF